MAQRQTASFLRQRFAEAGISPDTRHGQNFLIDLNLVELLAQAANVTRDDVVLEVGTGTGSLTALLARKAAAVVTVEIDQRMFQLAGEELAELDNVVMLRFDALKNKNRFNPDLLAVLDEQLAAAPGRQLKLAANLPYNIATPVVSNLLHLPTPPTSMTVTIQKELADRIVAPPSTKDYSALSVWMQSQCHVHLLRTLPPSVFWPRPTVDSAIIQVIPDLARRAEIGDLARFHEFVRAMFLHRRKFLRSVILSAFKRRLDKPQVDRVMAQLNLDAQSRAEQLDTTQMRVLCDACYAELEAVG